MPKARAHRQRYLWAVLVSLALLALAVLSTARSSAESEAPGNYVVYLPFVANPPPTPTPTLTPTTTPTPTSTPTATPTATPVPPNIRVDPPCCKFDSGTAQDPTGEYVCFRSYDERAINMTGWLVRDNVGLRYTFPTFVLPPGAVVKLHSGHGQNTATDLYRGGGLIWNNDGDTVYLRDASGNEVDTYSY
jgi:hypothetical protein